MQKMSKIENEKNDILQKKMMNQFQFIVTITNYVQI